MTKRRRGNVLLVVAIALAALGWWLWQQRNTPERQIRSRLDALSEIVAKAPQESTAVMVLKTERLQRGLAEKVAVETTHHELGGTYSAEDLASLAVRVRGAMDSLTFSFSSVQIVKLTATTAVVRAMLHYQGRQAGNVEQDSTPVEIALVLEDGVWKFARFTELDPAQ